MEGDGDGRTVVTLHQARRHDADDAGVPVLPGDDEHPVPQAGGILFQQAAGGGKDLLLGLLPLGVDFRQTGGDPRSLVFVPAEQQFEGHGGVVHAARRIEPRRQAVADGVRRDRPACVAAAFQQRLQAGAHGLLQQSEAFPHQDAVFPHQRHHVGYRAEGRQFAVHFQQFLRRAAFQRGAELESHPGAAQALERAGVVGAARVHHGHRLGQRRAGQVMVGNDQVQAQFPGASGLLHSGNAVVHGNDQREALGRQIFQCGAGQPVPAAACGQLAAHMRAQAGQAFIQDSGGADPVHIIVAVDHDGFFLFDGLPDAGHRPVHIFEQERV